MEKTSDWIKATKESIIRYKEKLQDLEEFMQAIITEKIKRVREETQKGLNDRPEDQPIVTYIKNGPKRRTEWAMNADKEWILRSIVRKDKYWQPTEMIEFVDLRQADRECPTRSEFKNQQSEPLEVKFPSDKSIFAECVVGKDGQLLAPYLKREEPKIFWNNRNWLMDKTGLSSELCIRLRDVFKALRFNRKTILEILEDIDEKYICYLEALAEDLEDIPPLMYDPKLYHDHGILETDAWINSISQGTLAEAFPENHIKKLKYIMEDEIEPQEKKEPTSSPFGYTKIYHQEDGCSHEFLSFLKIATKAEIKGIMKNFFPRKGYKDEVFRPVFWYLTASQRSQAWIYINDRREELGMIDKEVDFTAKA